MHRKEDANMDEKEHWGGNERLLFELILETYLSLSTHFTWSRLHHRFMSRVLTSRNDPTESRTPQVVIHDATLDRTTDGSGWVKDMTLKQLQQFDAGIKHSALFVNERIPTLEERGGRGKKVKMVTRCEVSFCCHMRPETTFVMFVCLIFLVFG